MFAKYLQDRSRLALLSCFAALPGCWWDGDSHTAAPPAPVAPSTYHLGGSISGLSAAGLVLANGSATVSPAANATTFTFATALTAGTAYTVSVQTQPPGLNCSVAGGSGTINADVTSVAVTCSAASYQIGGTISGLTAAGLVLANGSDSVSPAAGATSFVFSTAVASGAAYAVTVQTQPAGLTCSVSAGSGTVATANVTNVAVSCVANAQSSGYTALAGSLQCPAGAPDQNGTGAAASLPAPYAVRVDASGNVYTLGSGVVDKVTPAGVVTTLAGTFQGDVSVDGTGTAASFGQGPFFGGIDAAGNIYFSELAAIRRITPAAVVTTVAGSTFQGYADGTGSAAQFSAWGLGVAADGTAYVADYGNHVIRKVSPAGVATTLAGQPRQSGYADGVGATAQFTSPKYDVVDANGTTFVADQNGMMVRRITSDGTVTTLAGGLVNGWKDGPGSSAQFYDIRGLALGPAGSLYVLDQPSLSNGSSPLSSWLAIRKIDANGVVTTVAHGPLTGSYFAAPAGNPLIFDQPIDSITTSPDGATLYATAGCAVGTVTLP
jgi:hypothetical protein